MKNGKVELTKREGQVIKQLWSGATNQGIAEELGLSRWTVEAHRASVMRKLRVTNTVELIRESLRLKVIKL